VTGGFLEMLQQSALLQYYLAAAFCLWPVLRVLSRMGLPRAAGALIFVPLLGFALVMAFAALKKWPRLPSQPKRQKRERRA
jgi:predicted PurR-regulated permease PerM